MQTTHDPTGQGIMMYPTIGLSEEQRAGGTRILNLVLADEYVRYTKTRNFHWNVVGPQFHALHTFFAGVDAPGHRVAHGVTARRISR